MIIKLLWRISLAIMQEAADGNDSRRYEYPEGSKGDSGGE